MPITKPDEVRKAGGFTSEFEDSEIELEIDVVEAELYNRYFLPKRSKFTIDNDYINHFISYDKVYEIVGIDVSDNAQPSGYRDISSGSDTFTFTSGTNFISFDTTFATENDGEIIRIRYIPKIHNLIAANQVALNLIIPTLVSNGEEGSSPQFTNLREKINRYKKILKPRSILKSSNHTEYDPYAYISIDQTTFR